MALRCIVAAVAMSSSMMPHRPQVWDKQRQCKPQCVDGVLYATG